MHLVLYQPEIPQNVGTLIRFAACMGISLDIIEPCGFLFTDKHLRRAGMDYIEVARIQRFLSWSDFCQKSKGGRRIAVTTGAENSYTSFKFESTDYLLMGQESVGFPPSILEACDDQVAIPMMPGTRSLNVALAASIVTSEALRQTKGLPHYG